MRSIESWNEVIYKLDEVQSYDSGVHVVDYIYYLSNYKHLREDDNWDANKYRQELMVEVLKCSDSVTEICLKCGEEDDQSITNEIPWSGCSKCLRWIHQLCIESSEDPSKDNFKCQLCQETVLSAAV